MLLVNNNNNFKMIQRIQTIFLFLALVVMGLMFTFPIINFSGTPNITYSVMEMSAEDGTPFPMEGKYILMALIIIVILLLAASIALFKNRKMQMNMVRIAIFFSLGIIAALFYYIGVNQRLVGDGYEMAYGLGYVMPIVAVGLSFLGLHFINKDEKLVKSVDRLRG